MRHECLHKCGPTLSSSKHHVSLISVCQDVGITGAHRVSFPGSSPALWTLNSYWPSFFVQRRVKNRGGSRRKPPSRTRLEFHRVKRPSRKIRTREGGREGGIVWKKSSLVEAKIEWSKGKNAREGSGRGGGISKNHFFAPFLSFTLSLFSAFVSWRKKFA